MSNVCQKSSKIDVAQFGYKETRHISNSTHQQPDQWLQLAQWFSAASRKVNCEQVQAAIDNKTKPPGSLGQLETVAAQLALLQDSLTPKILSGRVIVFGADHGISAEGVSAFPAEVTAQMMANFANGGAAVSVFSNANGLTVEAVDVGVASNISHLTSIVHAKIANGTHNFSKTAAMNSDQLEASLEAGKQATLRAIAGNHDCIGLGEMGIANTSSASAIIALLLNVSAKRVTGRGTGVDDAALAHKSNVIQDAIDLHNDQCTNPMLVLQHVGGFEIAAMTGAMLEAHQHNLPVLVDGFISTAAALVAVKHQPDVQSCLFFSHRSAEAGHEAVLNELNAHPLLQLDMRLGEGSATALAYPLLRSACAMLCNMATFAEAGVTDKPT